MARQSPLEQRYDKLGMKVIESLKKRHFDAYYCKTKEDALQQILELIPQNHIVSWGGSQTLKEMCVQELIHNNGYQVIDRDTAKSPEERTELMRKSLLCDTFLMSCNAISEDGQLFNIDGTGNRVSAMIFGPKSVIIVAGMNKVVKTLNDAVQRARTIAAPANMQRFQDMKTPCYKTASCADCISPDCICAYMVTTRISRPAKKIKVILVGENLGL